MCAALFWLVAGLLPVHADADRAALHARIDQLQLAADPGWRSLLHLVAADDHSPVVDDWFFFSPQGRGDPAAELHATLDALIDDAPVQLREESARCVFGARQAYLARKLGADFEQLAPQPACERRTAWLKSLDARQMWIVFPSGYLNSPSSMFGHTLLRVDSKESQARGPLLAYAVNFVAETTESNGLVFAVKGLAGGYVGRYSVLPYYEKVREYVRLESRDLWEYPLQLSAEEQNRLLLHVWELRGAGFTYYFFTRNCAYQVLALLQTLRPEQDLLSGLQGWAIPTDTLRILRESGGWIGKAHFRPALNTTLRAHADRLDPAARRLAARLGHGRSTPADPALAALPPTEQARTLDVAHDLVYSRYQSGGSRDALLQESNELLAARAKTGVRSDWPEVEAPPVAPDQGHRTQRVGAGAWAADGGGGPLLSYRGAYHDLLDDPAGYTEGAQIGFLDGALRYDTTRTRLQVDHVKLLDIVSLARRDDLLAPISWRVSTGLRRDLAGNSPLRGYLDGGPGLSFGRPAWLGYAFTPIVVEAGQRLDSGYDLGGGLALGTLAQFGPALRANLELGWRWGIAGAHREDRRLAGQLQWDLDAGYALRFEAATEDFRDGRGSLPAGSISLLHYF